MSLFLKQILLFSLVPISLICLFLPLHHFHHHAQTPFPTFSNPFSPPPKIAYFITGTKNDGPRIFRLLQAVYHPRNYYLLHLDQFASNKQRLELALKVGSVDVFVAAENVNVIEKADAVNQEGSSPLGLVLHGAAALLRWKNDWDWFVNLDASDYPLIPQDDFLHILSFVPRNLNFIEYSKNTSPDEHQRAVEVIVDSRLYILLKGKMFVGDKKRELPSAFRFFMGSLLSTRSRDGKICQDCSCYTSRTLDLLIKDIFRLLHAILRSFQTLSSTPTCDSLTQTTLILQTSELQIPIEY
ncbi:beta-glucuronosyltransferase GlcAT14C-like isoform X2 [Nicotiana sylvestris]|uniref:beta-glucuronosyltransferase GlcAT14C-like isoform X2 n=1 Tax=Nicotiana sylvestris TaxID=4096 RepID=UPI00388C5978